MTCYTLYRQDWLESERGWGIRPDGYSLHASRSDCGAYIKEYWDRMPDEVPDEYSRPDGEVYTVEVSKSVWETVVASKNGTRHFR
jgi:hypothetical protein